MKIYINDCTCPYFNLAAEQYLLDNETSDIFMLWRNDKSVIIGKNQNAYAEINREFTEKNGIAVVRRLTGGGAVFHDLGNLNYTYIVSDKDCKALDFERFSMPIIKALKKLGVDAELSGRNDILVGGKKISGNAQCAYNGKIMHHGTLLFSSDLSYLSEALSVDPEKIRSKGIKSVRSRVCNISELVSGLTVLDFKNFIESQTDGEITRFTDEQISAINELSRLKYSTWEWNFGRLGSFEKNAKKHFSYGTVDIALKTEKGIISDIRFFGDYFGIKDISQIEKRLSGAKCEREQLLYKLSDISEFISGAAAEDIAELILG